jgi:RNA polymerase sigma-70 factor (ECF subfamily)
VDLKTAALRAGAGDRAALAILVEQTNRAVWRVCAALVDVTSAEDLTQETYLRAVPSLPAYRGESSLLSWLLTIARRVCVDEIGRRQRERKTLARLAAERRPFSTDPMAANDIADAVNRLSDDRREALLLTTVAGLSYADAATICGCPVGTIRSRVARAREELVEMLRHTDQPGDALG